MAISYSETLTIDGKMKACEAKLAELNAEIVAAGETARATAKSDREDQITSLQTEISALELSLKNTVTIN